MTIDEAANYGDISIFYMVDDDCDDNVKKGWQWDLNCGYQTWGSDNLYETPNDAMNALIEFLKSWRGPTK